MILQTTKHTGKIEGKNGGGLQKVKAAVRMKYQHIGYYSINLGSTCRYTLLCDLEVACRRITEEFKEAASIPRVL